MNGRRKRKHELTMVELWTNPRRQVQGFTTYCPHLAVTPIEGSKYYHITHIPTGAKLDGYGLKFRAAFVIAAALGGLMDWAGSDTECAIKFRALPQDLQRWAREAGQP